MIRKLMFPFIVSVLILVILNNLQAEESPKSIVLTEAKKGFFPNDHETRKIFRQKEFEDQARKYIRSGEYGKALENIEQAMNPNLKTKNYNTSIPHFLKRKVFHLQNRYEEALEVLKPLLEVNPTHQPWLDEKLELEALIKARDTNSAEPIYQHIQYLKDKYLSPKGFSGYAEMAISTIIRLYDHVGDYDSGISFIDKIMEYGYSKDPKLIRVKTSAEAMEHKYKGAAEYLKLKEAFEQDKAKGRKSCINSKPGEVCMGRATKALIQSAW